jgi:hypothetical protein
MQCVFFSERRPPKVWAVAFDLRQGAPRTKFAVTYLTDLSAATDGQMVVYGFVRASGDNN